MTEISSIEIRIVTKEQDTHFKIIIRHSSRSFFTSTMIILFSLFFFFISQVTIVYSDCPFVNLCICNTSQNQVSCSGGPEDHYRIPPLEHFPAVTDYFFSNFTVIQTKAFDRMKFLPNHSITIHLMNITTISPSAFSPGMKISKSSKLSVNIIQPDDAPGLILEHRAFDGVKFDHLRFTNVQSFNGEGLFPSDAFGDGLYINELIFEQSNLTGFDSNNATEQVDIEHLYIRNCPSLTDLTRENLPTFLQMTKTLELSGTGLTHIDHDTFEQQDYIFRELLIKNNPNFKHLSTIMNTTLQTLEILDLSNNSITSFDPNYDWSYYQYTKKLILNHQSRLDLFLKTNILNDIGNVRTIDFSHSIIGDDDEDLITNHVSNLPNLAAINISFTNFTDDMIIDLLTIVSNSANQTIEVSLLNHTLNGTYFCSYYQIFKNAPNFLRLELDENHPCNCIIDLFFNDDYQQMFQSDVLIEPVCVTNTSRARCDIQNQLTASNCPSRGSQAPNSNVGDIGTIGFIATMVGLFVVVLALLALGSRVVYRARRVRGMTVLDMDDPGVAASAPATPTMPRSIENSLRRTNTTEELLEESES